MRFSRVTKSGTSAVAWEEKMEDAANAANKGGASNRAQEPGCCCQDEDTEQRGKRCLGGDACTRQGPKSKKLLRKGRPGWLSSRAGIPVSVVPDLAKGSLSSRKGFKTYSAFREGMQRVVVHRKEGGFKFLN